MLEKPQLLLHSNAPYAGTGYGQQTGLFALKLREHFNLTISAFYGLEGAIVPWNGIPVLPGVGATYGNECIEEHVRTVFSGPRAGLVMTLMDVWVLDPSVWGQFNLCSWVPVDHRPAPHPVVDFLRDSGSVPLAMSKFGMEQLAELDPIYVPHGVDTKVYKPYPRAESREATGLKEDAFIVGMFAANKGNPSRKNFVEAFQAFKAFLSKNPDALLYLHTEVTGRFQGVNLLNLMDAVKIPQESVVFADQYRSVHFPFPPETMARLYSACDVVLAPSAGEGFGIPVIEAQACGVPVIVSDFSAQPELVGAGWTVEGTEYFGPIGSWQFRPNVEDIIDALEQAHGLSGARQAAYKKKAREKAEEYDADKVFTDHMLPALAEVQRRWDARRPTELKAAA